ncbi:hypothetical protein JCM11641_007714 [Rhodosporidiobolus odoratus]
MSSATTTTLTATFSTSLAGRRPFTLTLPNNSTFSFDFSLPSITPSPSSSSSKPLSSSALKSSSSGDGRPLLALILPILFGALILLAALYALLHWQQKRIKEREREVGRQAAKLRRGRVREGGRRDEAGREVFELKLKEDQGVEEMLETLKYREDIARVESNNSTKTFDLPRKPPPAYEA